LPVLLVSCGVTEISRISINENGAAYV